MRKSIDALFSGAYKTLTRSSSQDVTFEEVLGVTDDNALFDQLYETRINMNIRGSDDMIKIQTVPEIMLRNEDLEELFKPRELSIGPIHAVDHDLFKKELKLELAVNFLEFQSDGTYEDLLQEIKNIEGIKAYFDEEVIESYTDEELIRLLFLDGCAMLGFIYSYMSQTLNRFKISKGQAFLIQQDLFLLENQIPFRVLEVLIKKSQDETGDWEEVFRFIRASNVIAPNDSRSSKDERYFDDVVRGTNVKPVHILDLKRRMLLHHRLSSPPPPPPPEPALPPTVPVLLPPEPALPPPLAAPAPMPSPFDLALPAQFGRRYQGKKLSFRNVGELKTAGIKFKPTDSLTTISFHTPFFITGQLRLPTPVVDDSTTRKLLNLVAYEMCLPPDDPENCWVTSYINLLDLLIDNEQDVKDLRAVDLVRNCLSSDFEVARLINSIGSRCFTPSTDCYEDFKDKIEKHYKRRLAIWMTQFCHTHFSTPWTIIALLVATTLLALTAIQTWYAPKN